MIFAFIVVYFYNNSILQCSLVSIISMLYLIKIIKSNPYVEEIDTIR
jgi:hypothetical protein